MTSVHWFQINRTADSVNKNNEKMFSMRQLEKAIDSLEKENGLASEQSGKDLNCAAFRFITYARFNMG